MSREEAGESEHQNMDWKPNESNWPELGILETGIERIHLRRASLPAGRSGLWTSNFAGCLKGATDSAARRPADLDSEAIGDGNLAEIAPECHQHMPRSRLSSDQSNPTTPLSAGGPFTRQSEHAPSSNRQDFFSHVPEPPADIFPFLPTRLSQRRESLPFNFFGLSQRECWSNQGRRESLPTDCSSITLNAGDIVPELSITSMTPLRTSRREKRSSSSSAATGTSASTTANPLSNYVQSPTSVPFSFSDVMNLTSTEEKENMDSTPKVKSVTLHSFAIFSNCLTSWNIFLCNLFVYRTRQD